MGNPCKDETMLSAFIDGELPEDQRRSVSRHLEGCDECQRLLTDLKTADGILQGLDDPAPSADFDRTFWAKVDNLEERSELGRWWKRWARPAWRPMMATGLTAALAIGVFVLTGQHQGVSVEDRFIAENIEFLDNYDMIHHLEILEDWDAMDAMKELS